MKVTETLLVAVLVTAFSGPSRGTNETSHAMLPELGALPPRAVAAGQATGRRLSTPHGAIDDACATVTATGIRLRAARTGAIRIL